MLLLLTVTQDVRQSEIWPKFNFLLLSHVKTPVHNEEQASPGFRNTSYKFFLWTSNLVMLFPKHLLLSIYSNPMHSSGTSLNLILANHLLSWLMEDHSPLLTDTVILIGDSCVLCDMKYWESRTDWKRGCSYPHPNIIFTQNIAPELEVSHKYLGIDCLSCNQVYSYIV